MRTFIAIELSQKIKEYLLRLQDKLKLAQADVKWVSPQNIHLTLKFLGEINEKKVQQVMRILEDIAGSKEQFSLQLSSIGAFPKVISPRVIWIGVAKGDVQVKEIAKELEDKLSQIGLPKEDREFSSHITLGRMRSFKNRDELVKSLLDLKDKSAQGIPELLVEKITLFKSTLTPQGPIYEVLKEAYLKKT